MKENQNLFRDLQEDFRKMKKNLLVAQSGGPTAAINATLAGVIGQAMKEEQIDQHIMKSVYEAINEHGYCDINLCADTIPEPRKDIQIPTFMTQYARGGVIENGNDKRKRG